MLIKALALGFWHCVHHLQNLSVLVLFVLKNYLLTYYYELNTKYR